MTSEVFTASLMQKLIDMIMLSRFIMLDESRFFVKERG